MGVAALLPTESKWVWFTKIPSTAFLSINHKVQGVYIHDKVKPFVVR